MLGLNKTLEMDTAASLLLDRKNRKSIGSRRRSGSPKTTNGSIISLLSTPPSSKSVSKRSEESKCITPQMRKKTFVAEESPSQDFEYFSPNRLSQEFESRDVEWEWGDKSSYSIKTSEEKKVNEPENERTKRYRHLCSRRRSQHRQSREESRKSDQKEKGFYKFKKEVEQLFQRSLTNDYSSKESSGSAQGEESRSKALIERTENSRVDYFEMLPEQSHLQKADSISQNCPATAKADIQCNLLDNSDIDAMLLEASQSAEEHIVKRGVAESSDNKAAGESLSSDVVEIVEINSDGDSIDEILLSIHDDEFMKMTQSGDKDTGYSSASQRGKTSFSRYNSMPPKPLERFTVSSTVKPFVRHSSMPSDNASPSSNLLASKLDDHKRICTKEEMEKKKLEAKKRQLISQRRRLQLNSKSKALVLR